MLKVERVFFFFFLFFFFFDLKIPWKTDSGVTVLLIKAHRTGCFNIFSFCVLSHETANARVNITACSSSLRRWRNQMTLGNKFTAKSVEVLNDSSARRSRMEAMGNSIPGELQLVPGTLVANVQKQLFCHARAFFKSALIYNSAGESTYGST